MPDNTQAYDGPSPAVAERADDAQYAGDFATMVAIFRTEFNVWQKNGLKAPKEHAGASILARVAYVLKFGSALSQDVWLQDFAERWGVPAVLRAMATAIAQPEHVIGELEGD